MGPISPAWPVATTEQKRRNYALLCAIWCAIDIGALHLAFLDHESVAAFLRNAQFRLGLNHHFLVAWVFGTAFIAAATGAIVGWRWGQRLANSPYSLIIAAAASLPLLILMIVQDLQQRREFSVDTISEHLLMIAGGISLPFLLRQIRAI